MAVFFQRSPGYQVGLVGLFLFCVVYLVGYATPHWLNARAFGAEASLGLWEVCLLHVCTFLGVINLQYLFHISRALATAGMVVLLIALLYGLITNCCAASPRYTKALEKLGAVGGILAFTGSMCFLGAYRDFILFDTELAWSFYLAVVGSAGAALASVLLIFTNKDTLATTPPGQNDIAMGVPYTQQSQPSGMFQSVGIIQGGGGGVVVQPTATPTAPVYPAGIKY